MADMDKQAIGHKIKTITQVLKVRNAAIEVMLEKGLLNDAEGQKFLRADADFIHCLDDFHVKLMED